MIDEADDMFKQQDTKDKRSMSLSEQARFIIRSIPRDVESQVSLASSSTEDIVVIVLRHLLRDRLYLHSACSNQRRHLP